jgi:hypothetical protein
MCDTKVSLPVSLRQNLMPAGAIELAAVSDTRAAMISHLVALLLSLRSWVDRAALQVVIAFAASSACWALRRACTSRDWTGCSGCSCL